MNRIHIQAIKILSVLALVSLNVIAQTAGNSALAGTVRDSSGAAVPDAAVELTDVARGLKRTTQSNEEGAFLLPALTPGAYQLRVRNPLPFTATLSSRWARRSRSNAWPSVRCEAKKTSLN